MGATHQATARSLPADVIRITLPKERFAYKGGQYCNLAVPEMNLQFHPMSISSSPHEDYVVFHIRVLGNWTSALQQLVEGKGGQDRDVPLPVLLAGPYGAVSVDIDGPTYKSFLLVSGGIGITPMQSIFGELIDQHQRGRKLEHVRFVWSVADKLRPRCCFDTRWGFASLIPAADVSAPPPHKY